MEKRNNAEKVGPSYVIPTLKKRDATDCDNYSLGYSHKKEAGANCR